MLSSWKTSPYYGMWSCPRCRRGGGTGRKDANAAWKEEKKERKYIATEDLVSLLSGMPWRGTKSSGEAKPTAAGDVAVLLG